MTSASKALARCWDARAKGQAREPVPGAGRRRAPAGDRGRRRRARRPASARRAAVRTARAGAATTSCPRRSDSPPPAPDVSVPGGASCAGPVDDAERAGRAVSSCVAAHDGQCADRAAVPAFAPYPPECAAPPGTCERRRRVHERGGLSGRLCLPRQRLGHDPLLCRRRLHGGRASAAAEQCAASTAPSRAARRGAASARDSPAAPTRSASTTAGSPAVSCAPRTRTVRLPLGVCVNSTFGAGLCISSTPCQ